jgi:predicted nucleic acid-binding protein
MSYLLDSNIVIDVLDGDSSAMALIERLAHRVIAISTITAMEVRHGLVREGPLALARFDQFLDLTQVLDVNLPIALRCGDLRASLAGEGKPTRTRTLDLMIACTAIHHGLTLITANVRDYRDIPGLRLYQ